MHFVIEKEFVQLVKFVVLKKILFNPLIFVLIRAITATLSPPLIAPVTKNCPQFLPLTLSIRLYGHPCLSARLCPPYFPKALPFKTAWRSCFGSWWLKPLTSSILVTTDLRLPPPCKAKWKQVFLLLLLRSSVRQSYHASMYLCSRCSKNSFSLVAPMVHLL